MRASPRATATPGPSIAPIRPGRRSRSTKTVALEDVDAVGAEDLVVTGHGTTQRVAVPEGWAPRMSRRPVRVGDLTQGVLLSQEGGDSDTWGVYVRWAGQVQRLLTRGPVALGGGFTRSGSTAYLSWAAGDGRLYTRIGTPRPGRFHVYAWVPTSVTAGTAPVLAAQDLGVICIDETLGTYGTCTH